MLSLHNATQSFYVETVPQKLKGYFIKHIIQEIQALIDAVSRTCGTSRPEAPRGVASPWAPFTYPRAPFASPGRPSMAIAFRRARHTDKRRMVIE